MSKEAHCPKIDTCTHYILEEDYERACLDADGRFCHGVRWVGRTWPRFWKKNRGSSRRANTNE